MHIPRTLDPETQQSGVVSSLATAERNRCSADGAFSLETRCQGDSKYASARALKVLSERILENLLDKVYFVVEQGGLSYGGGDD